MVELKGSLASVGLPAIVRLIGELRHSGNLELTTGASQAVLGFDDGHLVAARFGEQRGLDALAACAVELAHSDFVFVEGLPADERTMDLKASELQKYLDRLVSGEVAIEAPVPAPVTAFKTTDLGPCPVLGFADDPSRHYSRATALHRCFADGRPGLVTGQEQRELCLSGRYPTCQRYRNASTPFADASRPSVLAPPLNVVSPGEAAQSPPSRPTGSAARMAAAGQTSMPSMGSSAEADPAWHGQDEPGPETSPRPETGRPRFGLRSRRSAVMLAIGAGLGVVVLAIGLRVVMPALNGGLAQKPSNAATPIRVAAAPLAPTDAALPGAASTAVKPRVAIPPTNTQAATAVPAATAAPDRAAQALPSLASASPQARAEPTLPAGQTLMDVRFASGPKEGWLDNPPFVTWSDGAYRLQARQPAHFVAVGAPVTGELGDVVVFATFRKTGGPPGGGYGLLVRDQNTDPLDGVNQNASAYVLEAGDQGEFGIWRRDGDHWVDLVPWTRSASVRIGGSPNDLMVRAIGDGLTFLVNATEVATVHDHTLQAGGVGVFVGGDYNEVALDRFAVQVPD